MAKSGDITIKLELEGANEFKKALSIAKSSITAMNSELKKIASEMALSKNKQDLMRQSLTTLGSKYKQQKEEVAGLNKRYTEARNEADKLQKEYRELAKAEGEESEATQKAKNAWLQAERTANGYADRLNNAQASMNRTELELRQMQQELIKTSIAESKFGQLNKRLSSIQPTLNKVAGGFMRITKAVAGLGIGLVAISLRRAFAKLETLEEVRATFRGLGKDTKQIQELMDAVSNSVTGTKYGMAEMAQVSKGADASIGNYSASMEEYLSRIADISAFSGKSVTQVGTMFNKAMAKNKVDARLMNQLIQAGIPIYDDLARVTGKSTSEISEMVTKGQIGFEDLFKATERYKDLATELGMSTLKGAGTILAQTWGNVGVAFLEGAYEPMRKGLTNIVLWLKSNMDTIKSWGKSFGDALNYLIKYVQTGEKDMAGLDSVAQGIAGTLRPFVTVVSSLVKAFMELSTNGKIAVTTLAIGIGPTLKLASGMITLSKNVQKAHTKIMQHMGAVMFDKDAIDMSNKEIRKAWIERQKETLTTAKNTVAQRINAIAVKLGGKEAQRQAGYQGLLAISNNRVTQATMRQSVATSIATMKQRIFNKVLKMNPYLLVAGAVLTLVSALGIFLATNDNAREKVTKFFESFGQKAQALAKNFPAIMGSVTTALAETLPQMVDAGSKALLSFVEGLMEQLPSLIEMGTEIVINLINGFVQALPQIITGVTNLMTMIVQTITTVLPMLIQAGLNLVMSLAQGFVQALPTIIQSAVQLIVALIQGISQMLPTIIMTAIKLVITLAKGLIQALPTLVAQVPKIISALVKAFIQLGSQLITSGARLLKNVWSGVKSWTGTFLSNVGGFFKQLPSKIRSWIGNLADVGENWLKGLWNGISNAKDWVWNKIKGIIKGFKEKVKDFFGIKSPSRVMANEVGKPLAQGIGLGFETTMKSVGVQMQDSLDSAILSTDGILATASGSFVANFDYDELAQAMSNQGIYLDGRLIGRAMNNNDGVVAI